MDVSEIENENSLKAWLDTRLHSECISMAHRVALRNTPFLFANWEFVANDDEPSPIASFRCHVLAGIATRNRGRELAPIIDEACSVIGSAEKYAAGAAGYSTITIRSPEQAPAFVVSTLLVAHAAIEHFEFRTGHTLALGAMQRDLEWQTIRQDATALIAGSDLLTVPLWHTETPPDWFTAAEATMRSYWQSENPSHWSFWLRWWDAAVAGKPLDWQLQRDIALIPDDIWQSGPGPVAEAIAKIEAAHRAAPFKTPATVDDAQAPLRDRSARIKVISAQINVLRTLLDDEFELLRGHNGGPSEEAPGIEQQKAVLQDLRTLIDQMLVAMDATPSTALAVVDETLPVIVDQAQALVAEGGQPQVSAEIIALAACIKVLTESGAPGSLATGIAVFDMTRAYAKRLFEKPK
jgi:hypothetical protein